jgi:hypothetical protein
LPFGTTAGPRNGEIPPEGALLDAFKSFKPDTAPGISGWTHHLLDDIRITGWASSGLGSQDIDIAIVSLASQDFQTATRPLATTGDYSVAERTAKLVEKHLNPEAREKRRRHPPSDGPFRPFVFSLAV